MKERGYETPEEAALASYSQSAGVFVVRVVRDGDCAEVDIDTDPSLPYLIECMRRRDGLWYERGGY
jgi:hypothetical protein